MHSADCSRAHGSVPSIGGRMWIMECANCGEDFIAHSPRALTCSTRCRVAKHRSDRRMLVLVTDGEQLPPPAGWAQG